MERSTTEEITNFWSHFPTGLTFGELRRMSPEERAEKSAQPAAALVLAAEVQLESVQQKSIVSAA